MAIAMYLAMTAAEFSMCEPLPAHAAWFACHFSPSGPGLSNVPKSLPAHSLLIVDDSTPFQNHQSGHIVRQLRETVYALKVRAVMLDFQRPHNADVQTLVAELQKELPCPVAVSPGYALENSPVFVPPCPLNRPLKSHLAPYQGQEIWLDISPLPAQITVTPKGSHYEILKEICKTPYWESNLCCHYNIDVEKDSIIFILNRDHKHWLATAEALGITAAVGLYQEWK